MVLRAIEAPIDTPAPTVPPPMATDSAATVETIVDLFSAFSVTSRAPVMLLVSR